MSQSAGYLPTSSLPGLTLVTTLNAWMTSISTTYSGAAAPVTDGSAVTLTGQKWLDTATGGYLKAKLYDGTSSIEYGRYDTTNHWWVPPIGGGTATVASNTTTDLWSVPQAAVTVSGTTPITAMAAASAVPGTVKKVTFSGVTTLTHNATSLILPGAANITTAVGDTAEVEAVTSTNVRVRSYTKASGQAVLPLAAISAHTGLFNITAGAAAPAANSLSSILDAELGSTRGMTIVRGASTWSIAAIGTNAQIWKSNGTDPGWADPAITSASPTAGMGYVTGAGGAVTQSTNKTTGVTLNKITGQITMAAGLLNNNSAVSFTLTNSTIAAGDIIVCNHISGGTFGSYLASGAASAAGSCKITLLNTTFGNIDEQPVIGFAVIKAVAA